MISKGFIVVLALMFSQNVFGQTYSGPESVEYDYANSRWLIANTQSHQVLSRDSTGALSVFTTLSGTGPYGIEIVGDTLFCCNGGSIKGFLLSNAQQVFNVNVGASFLNGITHDNNGNLIATDFSSKAIYKINIDSVSSTPIATSMSTTPNGIIYDGANNRCVFVNWGSNAPVKAIDMTSYAITTLTTTTLGSCDGITRDGNGNYYVSSWSVQSVMKFDSSFSGSPVSVVSGLSNPADIFYNVLTDTLAIPNASNSTVVFHGFSTVGIDENIAVKLNPLIFENHIEIPAGYNYNSCSIFSVDGRKYLDQKNDNNIISIEVLPSGIYLFVVRAGEDYSVTKFIKN